MYNYIMYWLSKKNSSSNSFSKEFRRGYRNAWINNITDYKP